MVQLVFLDISNLIRRVHLSKAKDLEGLGLPHFDGKILDPCKLGGFLEFGLFHLVLEMGFVGESFVKKALG